MTTLYDGRQATAHRRTTASHYAPAVYAPALGEPRRLH